jgi:hypothetical protein
MLYTANSRVATRAIIKWAKSRLSGKLWAGN